jgi:hypothetical protein
MAILALTNAKVVVNSVDLSDHVDTVTLDFEATDLDSTAMSSSGWMTHLGGLKFGKADFTFNQDYASSSVDATLFAALGTVVAVTVNPVNAANSATNPQYQFNVLVTAVPGVSGKVGDLAKAVVSWPITAAVTRAVV